MGVPESPGFGNFRHFGPPGFSIFESFGVHESRGAEPPRHPVWGRLYTLRGRGSGRDWGFNNGRVERVRGPAPRPSHRGRQRYINIVQDYMYTFPEKIYIHGKRMKGASDEESDTLSLPSRPHTPVGGSERTNGPERRVTDTTGVHLLSPAPDPLCLESWVTDPVHGTWQVRCLGVTPVDPSRWDRPTSGRSTRPPVGPAQVCRGPRVLATDHDEMVGEDRTGRGRECLPETRLSLVGRWGCGGSVHSGVPGHTHGLGRGRGPGATRSPET